MILFKIRYRSNKIKTIVVVDENISNKERKYYKTYKVTDKPEGLDIGKSTFSNIEEIQVNGIKDISESIGTTLNSINPILRLEENN